MGCGKITKDEVSSV